MANFNTQPDKRLVSGRQLSLCAILLLVVVSGCGDTSVAELKTQLGDADSNVRQSAAKDLEELGARAAPAVEELAKCLSDEDPDVRYRASKTLGKIGADAKEAVPALAKLLKDEDKSVRKSAESAIRRIKKKSAS